MLMHTKSFPVTAEVERNRPTTNLRSVVSRTLGGTDGHVVSRHRRITLATRAVTSSCETLRKIHPVP